MTKKYYQDFIDQCKDHPSAPLFLPYDYNSGIWGVVAIEKDHIIGGWIGFVRGNFPVINIFTKGIWFDSWPVLFNNEDCKLKTEIIKFTKQQAYKEGIILLKISHWSRQKSVDEKILDLNDKCATFIIDLSKGMDELWKDLNSKLRNIIRKGQKSGIDIIISKESEAVNYLGVFQNLRFQTQDRALIKNRGSRMLLKSNKFFHNILINYNSAFFIAKDEHRIIAMALVLESGKTMYYFSGGSDLEGNQKTGASSLMIWKAIEYAKYSGLLFFDMGGVPVKPSRDDPAYGVFAFKKGFGGSYKEYSSGQIIIRLFKFRLLNLILKNKYILRKISRNE